MKTGQFMCFGTLQHLRNRFSTGYAVQIKTAVHQDLNRVKNELMQQLPGLAIQSKLIYHEISYSSIFIYR